MKAGWASVLVITLLSATAWADTVEAASGDAAAAAPVDERAPSATTTARAHTGDFRVHNLFVVAAASVDNMSFTNEVGASWRGFTATIGLPKCHYNSALEPDHPAGMSIPLGIKVEPMFWLDRDASRYFTPYVETGFGLGGTPDGLLAEGWVGSGLQLAGPVGKAGIPLFVLVGLRYSVSTIDRGQRWVFGFGIRMP